MATIENILNSLEMTEEQLKNAMLSMTDKQKQELLIQMNIVSDFDNTNKSLSFMPQKHQEDFFNQGSSFQSRMACWGNRCGKTFSGGFELTYHLTGHYPTKETHGWEWGGHRFEKAINAWVIGITSNSTRTILQKEVMGSVDARMEDLIGTGAIPKDAIISIETDGAHAKIVRVKHCPDGDYTNWVNKPSNISTVEFRSTQQGLQVLMGSNMDYIWLDEEDHIKSEEIYAQCRTRVMLLDGLVTLTMTPENGITPLIDKFQKNESLCYHQAGWDDCDHISEDQISSMLSDIPSYQHEMRRYGIPMMGGGLVYPISKEMYEQEPFIIPDHFLQLGALDFGFQHPTVFSKLAFDVENDIIYLTYQQGWVGKTPQEISPALNLISGGVEIAYPHDGNTASKDTGVILADAYRTLGVPLQHKHCVNADGTLSVESGVLEILQRMQSGRFKVFTSCVDFFIGAQRYQRKNGKINKDAFDFDFGDSARYGVMRMVAGDGANGLALQTGRSNSWLSDRDESYLGSGFNNDSF